MLVRNKMIGLTLALVATVFWASFYVVGRYVFGENENGIDPVFFSFLRFMIASVFFILLLGCKGQLMSMVKSVKTEPTVIRVPWHDRSPA